jgi:hypothetical protein
VRPRIASVEMGVIAVPQGRGAQGTRMFQGLREGWVG